MVVPTTPTRHDATSPLPTQSPLSDLSPSTPNYPSTTPLKTSLHNLHLSTLPPAPPLPPSHAIKTVFFTPSLLKYILSYIYDAPSDYQKGSYLIPFEQNHETYSLGHLYDLQWVCRYWQDAIYSLHILPFTNPFVAEGGDTHRLHIPFLTWLGSKMKEKAENPTVPRTDFSNLSEMVNEALTPVDGFSPTDFISDPPVSKIYLGMQADFHPRFTEIYQKNPDPKKRKAICCPIGPLLNTLEFSCKLRDRQKADRIMEDAFIITNPTGVTITDVTSHILGILSGYYRIKHSYMLWMVEIGFPAGQKEILKREPNLLKRMQQTLFETCNRSARIFLVDSRLEVKNEYRIDYKPLEEFDPFYDPTRKKKKEDEPEVGRLWMGRGEVEMDGEEEGSEYEEEVEQYVRKGGKRGAKKGKRPVKTEGDYIDDSEEGSYGKWR
ncbi:uncharacterized protein DFL_000095 [Arthrobotrys flagrans]|uniref:Uncharacterized protein n=1 Tax=Arthrobotrys flagrans TaxID=97331 RepID=A0A437ACS8_ARTFL|nr:hypothetical protein DFL_000095 [Arthrobotrys flagrans]